MEKEEHLEEHEINAPSPSPFVSMFLFPDPIVYFSTLIFLMTVCVFYFFWHKTMIRETRMHRKDLDATRGERLETVKNNLVDVLDSSYLIFFPTIN